MKHTRLMAIVLILALCLALILPMNALAASITVSDTEAGHTYKAYQIFAGDAVEGNQEQLANVTWGSAIGSNGAAFLTYLKDHGTVDGTNDYANIDSLEKLLNYLIGITEDNGAKAKAFAKLAADFIKDYPPTTEVPTAATTGEAGKGPYKFSGLDAGYYLIQDETTTSTPNKAHTSYLLKATSGDATIDPKKPTPTVDKTQEASGSTGKKITDHAIGDAIDFYLTVTLEHNDEYDEFEKYWIKLTDQMSAGLTYMEGTLEVFVNSTKITAGFEDNTSSLVGNAAKGAKLEVTIKDVFGLANIQKPTSEKDNVIVVHYKARLNDDATSYNSDQLGDASADNTVYLEYSNDPYDENGHGKTPDKKTYVYTYKIDLTKEFEGQTAPSADVEAGFKLYSEAGAEIPLVQVSEGVYRPWVSGVDQESAKIENNEIKLRHGQKLEIVGLDVGKYKLKETTVPRGYKKMDDIDIIIEAEVSVTETDTPQPKLDLSKSQNMSNRITNKKGVTLPSTGSVTLVVLVALAAVLGVGGVLLSGKKKEEQ